MEYTFETLLQVMTQLRKECPWDREQTHDSIKGHTIEEAYEVVHAIDEKNYEELKKELGDLLLHVVFHSEIAAGDGRFSIQDVLREIIDKLVRRHPHIFGDTEVSNSDDVKRNWEQLKMAEGRESVLDGVPAQLPALLKAYRLQDKASKIGFDWEKRQDVWQKVREEILELEEMAEGGDRDKMEEEFGDVLFSLVNYGRFLDINAEDALRRTIAKFVRRFQYIESRMKEDGKDLQAATLDEMDVYWEQAKDFD
ncbi:MAG: nucleoside triphosphate pyrophosphohydrolase [Ectothiorhodospiraceae bacterium]|nr:nucleoside triphosphate pyrophosphohydrolase [Ectothiorhodospiraceae bacterium]